MLKNLVPPPYRWYTREYTWFIEGTVATGTEQGPTYRLTDDAVAEDVTMHVKTSPTGQAMIADLNLGGTTIFSTKPRIAAGGTVEDNNHAFSTTTLPAGSELTCDVDQVGNGAAGADLTISLKVRVKGRSA